MVPSPAALVEDVPLDVADLDAEFELDMKVVEATYPIAKLSCDTSDNCGASCSGSACNSSMNDPF
ncbi:FxLD family lanthipeptide [Sphaerimonospora cavernae]|uniref:FxLD family lanthipeptide n=1 Tax=Sphaerimonospora cavernae TaxID=1740611 RepID=A0ABV6TZP6_9ACTN